MNERILVPNTPFSLARESKGARPGMGFITWTPFCSGTRPLSTFKNGTTRLTSHRYDTDPRPSISRSIVSSNKIAPTMSSPLKLGL